MANKGFKGRQISNSCVRCGVEWLADRSNKVKKRAICFECKAEEQSKINEKQREKNKMTVTLVEKKRPYTFKNRKPVWDAVRTEIKGMKNRSEWLPFIQNRMQEILNDKQLMDYINDTEIADYGK